MTHEITEIILEEDGFKIKDTNEAVNVLGGMSFDYTGYLNKKDGKILSKAIEEIRFAIPGIYELGKEYNGFLITGIKKDPRDIGHNLPQEGLSGVVFYQALKFEKKEK